MKRLLTITALALAIAASGYTSTRANTAATPRPAALISPARCHLVVLDKNLKARTVAARLNCPYCYDILIQCLYLTGAAQCYDAYYDCLVIC